MFASSSSIYGSIKKKFSEDMKATLKFRFMHQQKK